ncbi:MAG TPA: hypothetical protein VGB19_02490 [Actinomycetota bacterium]
MRRLRGIWAALRGRAGAEHGTTLAELMIVIMLLGLVVAPAVTFLISSQRNEKTVSDSVQQQQDARLALEQFSRALRESSYPQGLTYSQSSLFDAAADNDVTFYTDIDTDGIIEKVRYWLDSGNAQILRTVTDPDCTQSPCSYGATATATTTTVITNVRNADLTACQGQSGTQALFLYYSVDRGTGAQNAISSGGTINNLVDINYVKMTVVVDITPGKSPTCQTLETAVSLRNWRG